MSLTYIGFALTRVSERQDLASSGHHDASLTVEPVQGPNLSLG